MRASRLVGLLGLLQARGRMTAGQLASELEVSQRTILRDIEALSDAGIPVYAVRGSLGGFELLDGFRSDLPAAVPGQPRQSGPRQSGPRQSGPRQPAPGGPSGAAGAGRARILLSPRGRRLAALLGRPAGLRIRRSPRAVPGPVEQVEEGQRTGWGNVAGQGAVARGRELAGRAGNEQAAREGGGGSGGTTGTGGSAGSGAGREGWIEAWVRIESAEAAAPDMLALGAEVEVLHPPQLRELMGATARRIAELHSTPAARGPGDQEPGFSGPGCGAA